MVENGIIGGFLKTRTEEGRHPIRVEVGDIDDQRDINPVEAGERLAAGPTGKKRGWAGRRTRRSKLAVMGIPSEALDAGDPAYARCVRLASAYRKSRVKELVISHGYVSSGVSALLSTAAMALAASRFLYEKATTEGGINTDFLKIASRIADSARQNELAAWELCAREAVAQKRAQLNSSSMPWYEDPEDRGGKKKPGPKTKASKDEAILMLPPIGEPLDGFIQSTTIEEHREVKDGT